MSELSYIRRRYDKNLNFVLSESYDPLRTVRTPSEGGAGPLFVNYDMQLEMRPARASQEVQVDFGFIENQFPDGHFEEDAWIGGANLFRWSNAGFNVYKVKLSKDNLGVRIEEAATTTRDNVYTISSPDLALVSDGTTKLSVKVDYSFLEDPNYATSNPAGYDTNGKAFVHVLFYGANWNTTGKLYDLQPGGSWREIVRATPPGYTDAERKPVELEAKTGGNGSLSITSSVLPEATGELRVLLSAVYYPSGSTIPRYNKVVWQGFGLEILPNGEPAPPTESYTVFNPRQFSLKPEAIRLMHGDLPELSNNQIIYANGWYVNGTPSRLWYARNSNVGRTIQERLAETVLRYEGITREVITGTFRLRTGMLDFAYLMKDLFNYGRVFQINAMEYDDRRCHWTVELLEVYEGTAFGTDESLEFEPLEFNSLEFN